MSLHYRKDGGLDMRYSSSRAAVSSGYSGGGGGGGGGFASSSSGYLASSYSSGGGTSGGSRSGGLHYTRDGSLDMRYSSSKAAVSSGSGGGGFWPDYSAYSGGTGSFSSTSGLHYKRDGSLDMRYSSSKAATSSANHGNSSSHSSNQGLVIKRDGTPDMRYNSSKHAMSNVLSGLNRMTISEPRGRSIPSNIPLTKSGLPDMRTRVAKEWVRQRATSQGFGQIPDWVPRLKDGSVDAKKSVAAEYLKHSGWDDFHPQQHDLVNRREKYYEDKMANDQEFCSVVRNVRHQNIPNPIPEEASCYLQNSRQIKEELRVANGSTSRSSFQNSGNQISGIGGRFWNTNIKEIAYSEIDLGRTETELGRGAFGVVLKGIYKEKTVAVKRLHLTQLTTKERRAFQNEILILGWLGEHENLVTLYAYTLNPPSLVMEFVGLGNLSQLLHYNDDVEVEAKISDGRIKKNIALGIVAGMIQLHAVNVVHGDLKPQNILITEDYVAKITDFGLATLRGKTGSTTASLNMSDEEFEFGGTGAYMAPELLHSCTLPELSIDVYSFGILLNEVIAEEEPFSDQFRNFALRGPFAAVNHAKQGHRPNISDKTGTKLKRLIQSCWDKDPKFRPTFVEILKAFKVNSIAFPNSCS